MECNSLVYNGDIIISNDSLFLLLLPGKHVIIRKKKYGVGDKSLLCCTPHDMGRNNKFFFFQATGTKNECYLQGANRVHERKKTQRLTNLAFIINFRQKNKDQLGSRNA